jgi:phytoene dehydrogenase-like protein
MEKKLIAIVGAGIGGLAAGIYGQMNGFETHVFEAQPVAGGQCAGWQRKGYRFDACIHTLYGCDPDSSLYRLWEDLGAMPAELVRTAECVTVVSPFGRAFHDLYDLEALRDHMRGLSPRDSGAIEDYVKATALLARHKVFSEAIAGTSFHALAMRPAVLLSLPHFRTTLASYGRRFRDPLLRQAFPLLEHSNSHTPVAVHLEKKALGSTGGIAWPVGGSAAFAASIAKHYTGLGGRLHLRSRVRKILTRDDRAVGVALAEGGFLEADYVISDADGRRTIRDLLSGRYTNEAVRRYCGPPESDQSDRAVQVFLGVGRDLSREPSALILLLDRPVTIAGYRTEHLGMQLYGFDASMAPAGKGVIKVELVSRYSYWDALRSDRPRYEAEKQRAAEQVIGLLERYFPGLGRQVEAVDVATPLTWERYVGGSYGFMVMPNRRSGLVSSLLGMNALQTLPGLDRFYFAGSWATSTGALFANALSGRRVIERICRRSSRRLKAAA